MNGSVIEVEKLSKRFMIAACETHTTLRDAIARKFAAPFRANGTRGAEVLWALRDVSFDVKQGEVVGLIGRNGAGKSTLLKILSRITRPTTGWAKVSGRIGSLLEVGTGFHPELTGRENIFLSGAVLGMKKAEIQKKFDEIVGFSEVERFLDTPLKRYSSGMQMRLAFAVAAHLEPEILLVDEVLAVGDAAFQKKCLGKMGEVSRQGRTIVFVSHSMAAVNALCSRAVMLERGKIRDEGTTAEVTARYYAEIVGQTKVDGDLTGMTRTGTGKARFTSLSLQPLGASGEPIDGAYPGCDIRIEFEIECYAPIMESIAAAIVYDQNGFRVIDANIGQKDRYLSLRPGETAKISLLLSDVLLRPGHYLVGLWLGRHGVETTDHVEYARRLTILDPNNNRQHPIVYPGVYLCHFEENISVTLQGAKTLNA
jgi:lipopolysaccharide transport system ATP-binding protein